MTKILVPVDGSESSDKAVCYALSLVKGEEDEILLLNVQPRYYGLTPDSVVIRGQLEEVRSSRKESSKKVLDHTLEITKSARVPVHTLVSIGDPGQEICTTAKDNPVDSIVMGHRGFGVVKRAFLGSVAIHVLRDAPCPVTIVR